MFHTAIFFDLGQLLKTTFLSRFIANSIINQICAFEFRSNLHNLLIRANNRLNFQSLTSVFIYGARLLSKLNFEELLLEAVDEGLSSLGESLKQAIYFRLEKHFNLKRQEIPYKIEDFADAIEEIFGTGANLLEILIMKRLHEKIGAVSKWQKRSDFTFTEYVAAARRSFLEKKQRTEELVHFKGLTSKV